MISEQVFYDTCSLLFYITGMNSISTTYKIRIIWISLLFLSLSRIVVSQSSLSAAGNSGCNDYVVIEGKTNINQFELKWYGSGKTKTNEETCFDTSSFFGINIPVKDFETSNSLMHDDFMELMKANEYPKICIKISQDQIDKLLEENDFRTPDILLTIAGVSNSYNVPCHAYKCAERTLFINGSQIIHLKDFKMDPPVKLQGLVKVKDEIEVRFGFILTFTEPFQNIVSR
jgi:hypothetical protein